MGQSYRIRTEVGINKSINVELNQDFEFLEILSLKIQQADVYTRSCADYGVVVGRVTANNGFGIPNAKVSVFIPVEEEDLLNDTINTIYPYRTIDEKNEDGYVYNLLPYEKSYSKHAATGTFPSKRDVLTNDIASKIYERYFRFTVKTNESGDYMIFGVPLGTQRLVMHVDLSDIGEFSLTPQDLVRIGRATQAQVSGGEFRASTDINSLPQIVRLNKIVEISPLWGEPEICEIAINRVDFDLRDDANIDIQPTSIFMGSIFSTPDKFKLRQNCKPKDNMGNLCDLVSGPGQILSIRQTIRQDSQGNPILEQYRLEQAGNVIDEDGTWITELPMNLDYITTNEFGERVISYNPNIGIPTKAKYRFKIKWQQPKDLTMPTRRPHFLVPNIKEYGWNSSGTADPTNSSSDTVKAQQRSSYYFGLDWSGYTEGLSTSDSNDKIDSIVNCEDTFYEFNYNRVYTVASLIDQWKLGGRARFIGIKEVDDDSCSSTVNKFPVNEGFKNFDFLYFIFSLIFQNIQFIGLAFLIVAHFTVGVIYQIINFLKSIFGGRTKRKGIPIRLPMITYPECQACECRETEITGLEVNLTANGNLTPVSLSDKYLEEWNTLVSARLTDSPEDWETLSSINAQATGGNVSSYNANKYKLTKSEIGRTERGQDGKNFSYSWDLPFGERINIFNSRSSYFTGVNRIKVSFASDYANNNSLFHLDNTITVVSPNFYPSGAVLSTVNPETSTDYNFNFSGTNASGQIFYGITGETTIGPSSVTVKYANTTNQTLELEQTYSLPYGSTYTTNAFPIDREYFQVITAITVSEYFKISKVNPGLQTFADVLGSGIRITWMQGTDTINFKTRFEWPSVAFKDLYENFDEQYVLIMQRGVDPYSPKYTNKYNLGAIFGSTIDDPNYIITASTKMNIPIQKVVSSSMSIQKFNQNEMFYPSHFFTPGSDFSAFTTSTVGYYSAFDDTLQYVSPSYFQYDNFYSYVLVASIRSLFRPQSLFGSEGIVVNGDTNNYYSDQTNLVSKYDFSEDLSGNAVAYSNRNGAKTYDRFEFLYFSPTAVESLKVNPIRLTDKTKNIMRTDRLPSSDQIDGLNWSGNTFLLQQNINFAFYEIPTEEEGLLVPGFGTGFEQVQPDVEGLPDTNVLSSFDCPNMVGLSCYSGNGSSFGVSTTCAERDLVERGCYVFFTNPLFGVAKDVKYFQEWGYRFRFFYGICRGVLSQSFTNNWINGTLYAFPIQVDTIYDKNNNPNLKGYRTLIFRKKKESYCKDTVYFEEKTNNFYYRSSPYNRENNKFVGKDTVHYTAVNDTNLLFPTTVVNLGFKDTFYNEITNDPSTNGFILDRLGPTSFSDTSDIVNLFVISRITNRSFLNQFFSFANRNSSINSLFSRNDSPVVRNLRVDGDFAQLISINSEEGNIGFSPQFYSSSSASTLNPVGIYGTTTKPTIGIFYSSTTEDLQFKDFITPGRINFRPSPEYTSTPFNYQIKSQVVPFYRWETKASNQIFGTEQNDWATRRADIIQHQYQSLDRTNPEHYFMAEGLVNDISKRGYIFNVSGDTISIFSQNYKTQGPEYSNKFLVGAPFHFYFGTVVGASVLEKFKSKYSIDE